MAHRLIRMSVDIRRSTTMTDTTTAFELDRALKAKHAALWASGDYPAVADEVIADLGRVIVDAAGISAADRVLDIAAGSGNASIPAAERGASVVASDLTPELLESGRRHAALRGVELDWQVADAEALPFADAEFDAVLSCVGVMFAPHHQVTADELVRVTRPGGRIALLNWTPEGFIGQMFATMKPYAPPPPPGAQPGPLWGDPDHVARLLGDRVESFESRRQTLTVNRFDSATSFRDFFKACYGPTISTYRFIADDPEKVAALDHDLVELGRRAGADAGSMEWEYLLVTATRR
jgi:SAM-dependent methyltransferase